jgi:nitrous oxide reductase
MSILSVSSLLVVAAEYSQYGLLGGFPDGVVKWVVSFVLMDFSVYAWHYVGHHSEFLWRFHKIHHSDKSFHVTTGLDNSQAETEHGIKMPAFGFYLIAKGGQVTRKTFIFDKPGEYEFMCDLPGHQEAGMKGKLIVSGP